MKAKGKPGRIAVSPLKKKGKPIKPKGKPGKKPVVKPPRGGLAGMLRKGARRA
jgi:hypothetical protein